jgi:hypothetical protein
MKFLDRIDPDLLNSLVYLGEVVGLLVTLVTAVTIINIVLHFFK